MVPIHYGLNDPPHYVEYPGALDKTLELAKEKDVDVRPLQPGEEMKLD